MVFVRDDVLEQNVWTVTTKAAPASRWGRSRTAAKESHLLVADLILIV